MRFDVITLFPELFEPHTRSGVTRRAYDSGAIELKLWQLRDHADDAYRRVDDRPFGGGPGMVMLAEPLQRALADDTGRRPTAQELLVRAQAWRPWRAYAARHLWAADSVPQAKAPAGAQAGAKDRAHAA